MFIVDSGLAAHLLGATAARLGRPGQDAGPVLETFVTMPPCATRTSVAFVACGLQPARHFVAGVELHTGQHPLPFGDGLWAVPISTLWQGS
jgi:hypothetical protein